MRLSLRGIVLALALALALAAAPAPPAARGKLPLTARVIRPGEFPGFVPTEPVVLRKAEQWAGRGPGLTAEEVAARTTRLRREGFAAVVIEDLVPKRLGIEQAGLSYAVQLRSAGAARAELAATVAAAEATATPERAYSAFRVKTIPGARGYRLSSADTTGDNVVFADGRFVYLLGDRWAGEETNPPARSRVVAAAARLYRRVHRAGHPRRAPKRKPIGPKR
jgi:hypothetical protein